MATYGMLYGNM